MTYTVWSRGRLIGHSTLGYARAAPGMRAGDFEPTELGEKLMPIITGVGPALRTLHDMVRHTPSAMAQADGDGVFDFSSALRQTTEYADAVSIADERESLELELRDPDGVVIPTESLAVNDTEYLWARAREPVDDGDRLRTGDEEPLDPELEASIAHDLEIIRSWEFEDDWTDDDEEWREPAPFARYQIIVVLEGGMWGEQNRYEQFD